MELAQHSPNSFPLLLLVICSNSRNSFLNGYFISCRTCEHLNILFAHQTNHFTNYSSPPSFVVVTYNSSLMTHKSSIFPSRKTLAYHSPPFSFPYKSKLSKDHFHTWFTHPPILIHTCFEMSCPIQLKINMIILIFFKSQLTSSFFSCCQKPKYPYSVLTPFTNLLLATVSPVSDLPQIAFYSLVVWNTLFIPYVSSSH